MYRKFNLVMSAGDIQQLQPILQVQKRKNTNTKKLQSALKKTVTQYYTGCISAKDIEDNWFPTLPFQVFISHSHKDLALARQFAQWLEQTFKIKAFIDSDVWGYRTNLIQLLMSPPYCERCPEVITKVDTILEIALAKMLDQTECVFFLNTINSVPSYGDTYSSWIYYEIETANKIRCTKPDRLCAAPAPFKTLQQLHSHITKLITFPVHLNDFELIDVNKLNDWSACGKNGTKALDKLYKMYKFNDSCCCCKNELSCDFAELEHVILSQLHSLDKDFKKNCFYQKIGKILNRLEANGLEEKQIEEFGDYLGKKYGEFLNTDNLKRSMAFAGKQFNCPYKEIAPKKKSEKNKTKD